DAFYSKFAAVRNRTELENIIVTSIRDRLKPVLSLLFQLTKGRKIKPIPKQDDVIFWAEFLAMGKHCHLPVHGGQKGNDPAVILYSGGTSGTTKGILLSNRNFNALALQTAAMGECVFPGHVMLAILPIFHGFGLGVCIHTM